MYEFRGFTQKANKADVYKRQHLSGDKPIEPAVAEIDEDNTDKQFVPDFSQVKGQAEVKLSLIHIQMCIRDRHILNDIS